MNNKKIKITNIKSLTLIILSFLFSKEVFAQRILESGTMIIIQPLRYWNSNELNPPSFIVTYPIKDNTGKVVIKAGSPVEIEADWKRSKGVGKAGSVNITFLSVKSVNGKKILLNGQYSAVGENKKGLAHGLTWGLFLMIGPLSLPCLAIKGEPAKINHSITINTYVLNDVKIE